MNRWHDRLDQLPDHGETEHPFIFMRNHVTSNGLIRSNLFMPNASQGIHGRMVVNFRYDDDTRGVIQNSVMFCTVEPTAEYAVQAVS